MMIGQNIYIMAGVPDWAVKRKRLEVIVMATARNTVLGRYQRRRRATRPRAERKAIIKEGSLMEKILSPKRLTEACWRRW